MAGVKGRSGRKRKPLAAHVANGTWRRDRHGELPESFQIGANVLQMPATQPADAEPPAAVLAGLADEGSAFIRANRNRGEHRRRSDRDPQVQRSEEHTTELQSQSNL